MGCPAENTILSYAEGRLADVDLADLDSHIAGCALCQRLVAAAVELATHEGPATRAFDVASAVGGELARGTVIGRYTVLELAGRGGMGEVYAAFDEELNRKVALKLLRAHDGVDDERARARLSREARAMARLSHPNAVSVHDVGTYGARVFVAMEFVEGVTLEVWLSERPRTRPEILTVFAAAGRGLAAAHAAGLVHRDFKPQNVMIARDGSVRVMDFGLARAVDESVADPNADGDREHAARELDLTRTGELLGTPAYMAPEQFLDAATDARTDQFSFCVALYKALYGQRPFAGDTFKDLMVASTTGALRDPPPGARVPAWLRRVLARGLERDPARRFPSMEALLEALAADPTARTRRAMLVAAGAISVVGLVVGLQHKDGARTSMCLGGAEKLTVAWEPRGVASARKDGIRAAFVATGKSYASQAYASAANLLDDYVARWLATYRDTCEATQLRGEQSAEVLDLRMTCLQGRLTSVRALTDVMARADGNTVENAVSAAAALPSLDRCADVALLKAVVQPPYDTRTRDRVEELRGEDARLAALRDAGHCAEASALATTLLARVRAVDYPPLLAETLLNAGLLCNECESLEKSLGWLREGYVVAVGAHDDEAAAEAAILMSGFGSIRGHIGAEARLWLDIGAASLKRIEARPLLQAWWLMSEGDVLLDEGRIDAAVTSFQKSLVLKKRLLGDDNPDVLRTMDNLADGLEAAGRLDEALTTFAANTESAERVLGTEHILVGKLSNNEGEALNLLRRYAEARVAFTRSIANLQRNGTPPELVAYPLTGLGLAELGSGHPDEAIAPLEKSLGARLEHKMSPELIGEARFALARALWSREAEHGRAVSLAREARQDYAGVKTGAKAMREIDAWLAPRS